MSPIEEIYFSDSTMLGYTICGAVYFLLPVTAFLMLRRNGAARLYPVIVGVIVNYVSTTLTDLFANLIGFSESIGNRTVIAAEIVCFMEEGGRWLAMRYPITDIKNTHSAVCYGIGHGGLECILRGIQKFKIFGYGRKLNSEGLDSFISGKTSESADRIVEQLRTYADSGIFVSLLNSLHAVTNFGVHIALSVLIFKKISESENSIRWLGFAILMHLCLNGFSWLASFAGSPAFSDIIGILTGAAIIMTVCRITGLKNVVYEIRFPEK